MMVPPVIYRLLTFLGIGIQRHFGTGSTDGVDEAALDVHIAVGVHCIVLGSLSEYIATVDGHIAGRVDAVVKGIDRDVSVVDGEGLLALNTFSTRTGSGDGDGTTIDDNAAVDLDALGRALIIGVVAVERAGIAADRQRAGTGSHYGLSAGHHGDDGRTADGKIAVGAEALATGTGAGKIERTAANIHQAVGTEAGSGFGLEVGCIPETATGSGDVDRTAGDVHVAFGFETLACIGRHGCRDCTAGDIHIAGVLVLMIGGDTGRTDFGILDIALDAIVGNAADIDRTALHEEELLAVDTVTYCGEDVDGGILDLEVLAALDTVLDVTGDVERTLLCKLGMALDIEAAFLLTAGSIHEGVGGAVERFYLDTFAILDMNSRTGEDGREVGQRQVVENRR